MEVFKRSNITVVGISGDAVEKQKKFVDQHGLQYPVLSDVNGEVRKAYQVKKGLLGLSEGVSHAQTVSRRTTSHYAA